MKCAIPSFGADSRLVSGFAVDDDRPVFRIFVPLEQSDGTFRSWTACTEAVGIRMHPLLRWSSVRRKAMARGIDVGTPAMGKVCRSFIRGFFDLLPEFECLPGCFALWSDYADPEPDGAHLTVNRIPRSSSNFLCDGSFYLYRNLLGWAMSRSFENNLRFPVALWPDTGLFTVAAPIYTDSLYITCEDSVYSRLKFGGLDILPIDRAATCPSEGD